MAKPVTIIKVDPEKQIVARMSIKPSVIGVRAIIGCHNIGHRVLLQDVEGEMLLVGARVDQDPDKPKKEWRLRGGENTVGTGILFGTLNRKLEGMWHVPVDAEWVKKHIIWCEPGESAPAAEVMEAMSLCTGCGGEPVVFEPDDDKLCKPCADKWVQGEGVAAREAAEEGKSHLRSEMEARRAARDLNQARTHDTTSAVDD